MSILDERGPALGAAPAADLVGLAGTDRRVARALAAAERDRVAAVQRTADADAAVERELRLAEGRLRLAGQRDQVGAARAERRRQARAVTAAARRERRRQRRADTAAWWARRVAYTRGNAAAVYSSVIYGLAVSGAVYGQVDAAHAHGLPTLVGIAAAVAIEGTGLSMALTAQQQRLARERAVAARVLTWVATVVAVCINFFGHAGDPVKAVGLSVLSALGIVVWEVRSGARHRAELRTAGAIPDPPERFGWRRWVAYPRSTWAAWSLDVRDRLSPGAAALMARAELAATARAANATTRREHADRERVQQRTRALADLAARRAIRRKETGPALVALLALARTGQVPVDQPALPAGAPDPGEPAHQPGRGEPTHPDEPAREPATPDRGQPGEPARPARRRASEPGSRRVSAGAGSRRVLPADAAASRLAAAHDVLLLQLDRVPTGAELAAATGLSKATANRWKSTRESEQNTGQE